MRRFTPRREDRLRGERASRRRSALLLAVSVLILFLGCRTGRAQGAGRTAPMDVVLLVDESGSMYGDQGAAEDARLLRYPATIVAALKLRKDDRLAILPFTNVLLNAAPRWQTVEEARASRFAPLREAYARHQERNAKSQNGTSFAEPLDAALRLLGPSDPARTSVVALMSDGDPRAPGNAPSRLIRLAGDIGKRANTRLFTIGLGSGVKRGLMAALATQGGGRFVFVDRPEQLPETFSSVLRDAGGREVGRAMPCDGSIRFRVPQGASELRVLLLTETEGEPVEVVSPGGETFRAAVEPKIAPDRQGETVAWFRTPSPAPGVWEVRGTGTLDLSYGTDFRARIVAPTEGAVLRTLRAQRIVAEIDGSADDFTMSFTATSADGERVEVAGTRGQAGYEATLRLPQGHPGAWIVRATPRNSLGDEGVSDTVQITADDRPPGRPSVQLGWPAETRYDIDAGDDVEVPLTWTGSEIPDGASLRVEVEGGEALTAPIHDGSGATALRIRRPFGGRPGNHTLRLRAALSVDGDVSPRGYQAGVKASTLWDRVSGPVLGLSWLLILILACFGAGLWVNDRQRRAQTAFWRACVQSFRLTLHDGGAEKRPLGVPHSRMLVIGGTNVASKHAKDATIALGEKADVSFGTVNLRTKLGQTPWLKVYAPSMTMGGRSKGKLDLGPGEAKRVTLRGGGQEFDCTLCYSAEGAEYKDAQQAYGAWRRWGYAVAALFIVMLAYGGFRGVQIVRAATTTRFTVNE